MPASSKARIFIQVPAYRDSEVGPTLIDLYRKASRPDLLRVVLFWQRGAQETLPAQVFKLPGLEITEVPFEESQGCNWARNLMQQMWDGEPFTLLIDSHHRFASSWDDKLIEMHRSLVAEGVRRPLITAYLPTYNPALEPWGRTKKPLKIYPMKRRDGLLIRLIGYPIPSWRDLQQPIPADFVSLHLAFTDGRFNQDVPLDPECYFFGDEVSTSVRAFTSGFDLFHPHVVLGWHCYDRQTRTPHWDDHPQWQELEAKTLSNFRELVAGNLKGPYGLGNARGVAEYERRLGVPLCL